MTPKKGYNQKKYEENYDSIFRKKKNGKKKTASGYTRKSV